MDNQEILANFQSITAIDDVGEALMHLEECNWDLYAAIHRVIPPDVDDILAVPVVPNAFQDVNAQPNNLNDLNGMPVDYSAPLGFRNIYGPADRSNDAADLPIDLIDEFPLPAGQRPTATSSLPAVASSRPGQSSSSATDARASSSAGASNGAHAPRTILFNVHHQQTVHAIMLPGCETIAELRKHIARVTMVPPCRQALAGWWPPNPRFNNQTVLQTLTSAPDVHLTLTDLSHEGFADDQLANRPLNTFTIRIKRPRDVAGAASQADSDDIALKFPGTQTLIQVKTDVYTITDIPVRHQHWTGWPDTMTNDTTLSASGISFEHSVTLRSLAPGNAAAVHGRQDDRIDVETDESDFEDANDVAFVGDDDMFDETSASERSNRQQYLIEDNVNDEQTGSLQFVENYVARYGSPHPEFFLGSLEDAINEASAKPAKQRKLLAIYLHDDRSVLTNVFCDQLLKCDSVMQMLQHNFVLYGWDLTFVSNRNLFLSALSCVGTTATVTVRSLTTVQMPTMLIVCKSRSTFEVLSIINGNVGRDELLNKLIDTMNMYAEQREVETREENERAAREQVKMEQDEAYYESLEADRRKEESRRLKERADDEERRRLEAERAQAEQEREEARASAEASVPAEPELGTAGITKIRIRQPTGGHFERRFLGTSTLQHLLSFVASKGFPQNEYKVISSYPRRDLTTLDASQTLSHYKLCPQETVILEER